MEKEDLNSVTGWRQRYSYKTIRTPLVVHVYDLLTMRPFEIRY